MAPIAPKPSSSSNPISAAWHSLTDPMQLTVMANVSAGVPGIGGDYASIGFTTSKPDANGERHTSMVEGTGISTVVGYGGLMHTKDGYSPVGGVSVPFVSVGNDPITGKTIYVSVFGVGTALLGSKGALGVTAYIPIVPGLSAGPGVTVVDPRLEKVTAPLVQKALGWVEVLEPKVEAFAHSVKEAVTHSLPHSFEF